MSEFVDNAGFFGDLLPNVYVNRIVLSNGTKTTDVTGDDPHIDIPSKEEFLASFKIPKGFTGGEGKQGTQEAFEEFYKTFYSGLKEKKKTTISSYTDPDAYQQDRSLIVRVDCSIPVVVRDNLVKSFLSNEQLRKFLHIKVFLSTDLIRTNNFSSLSSMEVIEAASHKPDIPAKLIQLSSIPDDLNIFESSYDGEGNKIYNVTFSTNFVLEKANLNHVSVFVVPYIDKTTFQNSFEPALNIDNLLTSRDLELLYGKKIIEPVIVNGDVVTTATYYKDFNDLIWSGDIHLSGTFAVKGKDEVEAATFDNPLLQEIKVNNTVIQDFRVREALENVDIDLSSAQHLFSGNRAGATNFPWDHIYSGKDYAEEKGFEKPVFFSDLMITSNLEGQNKLIFSVNVKNVFLGLSKYGKLWDNLLTDDKNSVLQANTAVFKSLHLVRKRIESETNENLWNTYGKQPEPEEIIAKLFDSDDNPSGFIKPVSIDLPAHTQNGDRYLFFTALDKNIVSRTYGFYRYGLKFVFEDRIEKVLSSKIALLKADYEQIKQYYNIAVEPKNYNSMSDRFTTKFISSYQNEYDSIMPVALTDFISTHQAFFGGNYNQKLQMAFSLINISSPTTGTLEGLQLIMNLIENFINKVSSIMDNTSIASSPSDKTNTFNPSSVKSSKKQFFIKKEYYFNEVYDARNNTGRGYEFLQLPQDTDSTIKRVNQKLGISTLSYSDYRNRIDFEISKYFNVEDTDASSVLGITVYKNQNNTDTVVQKNIDFAKYTFFAPTIIKTKTAGLYKTLDQNGIIDYENLNLAFLEILKEKLDELDPSYKVSGKEVTNLTLTEKKEKYQLNQILGLKGCTYVTTATEGVSLFDLIPAMPSFSSVPGFNLDALQPEEEIEELPVLTPPMVDEPNFNDSLFFLSAAEKEVSHFHSFNQAINGKHDEAKGQPKFLKNAVEQLIPNQYLHLLALNNKTNISDPSVLRNTLGTKSPIVNNVDTTMEKADTMEKKYGIWVNYFNIVAVEFLRGFTNNDVKEPFFYPLTSNWFSDLEQNESAILCRMRYYFNENFQIKEGKSLNLPLLEKYFFLAGPDFRAFSVKLDQVSDISDTLLQMANHLNTSSNIPTNYLNANLSTKSLEGAAEAQAAASPATPTTPSAATSTTWPGGGLGVS